MIKQASKSQWISSTPFNLDPLLIKSTANAHLLSDRTHKWAIWVAKKLLKTDPNGKTIWLLNQSFNYEIYPYDQTIEQLGQKQSCDFKKVLAIFINPLVNDEEVEIANDDQSAH